MRIPLRKIYRAFPEFDSFSNEQCERFMRRIEQSGVKKTMSSLIGLLVGVVVLVLSCAASGFIYEGVALLIEHRTIRKFEVVFDLLQFLFPLLTACVLGLISRDILLRRHLRLVIEDKINRIRCLACKYILIGQRVTNDSVRCPECGRAHRLGELGVVEADLIPPQVGEGMQPTQG